MIKVSLHKTKVSPLYNEWIFFNLSSIYKLEVLKCVYNLKKSALANCFSNYYQYVAQTRNYPTRLVSENNLAIMKCNTSSTQPSIPHTGCKYWDDLPEKVKTQVSFNQYTSFQFHIKKHRNSNSYRNSNVTLSFSFAHHPE